jgi:cytochrome c
MMIKKHVLIYASTFAGVFLCAFANPFYKNKPQQENQPPVVKIISPQNNELFDWDSPLNYEITVADKDDGNSKYDELNAKEVLLEVRYAANKPKMQSMLNKGVQNDARGLALMRSSNCFNCHNFNSKAQGPSFNDISEKYPVKTANIDSLVKHIRKGSTGLWGKERMPTHPELTTGETKSIVQWILKTAKNPDVNYYIGLTGSFRIKSKTTSVKKGAYILTASYTDHGLKSTPAKRLKGQDIVVIFSR